MVHRYSGYPGGLKSESVRQPARSQARRRHPSQRPRHAAEGPARPPADQEAQGVRRAPSTRTPHRTPSSSNSQRPRLAEARAKELSTMATKPLTQTTGRRKEAVARARLRPGTGVHTINGRAFDEYFTTACSGWSVTEALRVTEHRRGLRRRRDDARWRRQRSGRRTAHGDRSLARRARSRGASPRSRRPACSPATRVSKESKKYGLESRPARPSSTPSAEPNARPSTEAAHMTLRFGTDGVRGSTLTELTPQFVASLGRAASAVLHSDRWIVGRDTRESGAELSCRVRRWTRRQRVRPRRRAHAGRGVLVATTRHPCRNHHRVAQPVAATTA